MDTGPDPARQSIGQTVQQPPSEPSPDLYRAVSPEQRQIWERKGRRAVIFGVLWVSAGLLITLITYARAQGGGVYIVAWGPMLYGAYRFITGVRLLNKRREPR